MRVAHRILLNDEERKPGRVGSLNRMALPLVCIEVRAIRASRRMSVLWHRGRKRGTGEGPIEVSKTWADRAHDSRRAM